MTNNFFVTSPIYYVNDAPHIGHAYTSIACDVLARFHRLKNHQVFFLTGTDEHGQKVEKSASNKSKNPQQFCDEVSQKFRELATFLNLSNDDFIRTTDERHKKTVTKIWEILQKNGYIYKDIYEGWYAVRDEAFYNADEIIDGKAPTGAEVSWHREESYFFRLSAFQDKLLTLYEAVPDFIRPLSRYNEVVSFVKSGLKDLSISRTSFSWGIKVPNDEKHVIYVWLDALFNYISALNFDNNSNENSAQLFQNFWNNATKSPIHIVGKDIVRFHAVYWPAFLMACDLNLPYGIYAHGWWTNEGQKISKSVGNIIDPLTEIQWLKSFGLSQETAIDYFRYFLMREVPFGNDGDHSRNNLILRLNSELVNNIGNLVQRCMTMIYKNCDGKIPISMEHSKTHIEPFIENYFQAFDDLSFDKALQAIIDYADLVNKRFNDQAPWSLFKNGKIKEMHISLHETAEAIRLIAILLKPFIPNLSSKILDLLNMPKNADFTKLLDNFADNHQINEPKIIFPRLEKYS